MGHLIALVLALQAALPPPLVGLWDFPGITGEPLGVPGSIAVRVSPSASAALVAHLDKDGITLAGRSTRACTWVRDFDLPTAPRGCIFTESGYEVPSLAVFGREGRWLRIALDDNATRFGWIEDTSGFHALADLVAGDGLTYFTASWNRTLYDSPGLGSAARTGRTVRPDNAARANSETPYKAIGRAIVQGRLWLHVQILDEVCGNRDPRVIDTGWVPAQSPAGAQWAWFWSRGC